MRSFTPLVLAALLGVGARSYAAEPQTLDALMAANIHPLELRGTRLSGPGAEWLRAEATRADFFMLGEQHATREVARLATGLVEQFASLGYRAAAIEVGPFSTPLMERMLRKRGGKVFENYARDPKHLLPVPFYTWSDELEFVRSVVKAVPEGDRALWGLDQEFIGAGDLLLDELEELASNKEQRAAVDAARAVVAKDAMALGLGDDAPWQRLAAAFETHAKARALTADILVSRRIYAPFTNRGGNVYLANDERESYMKTQLVAELESVERRRLAWPKVFMKFGANHLAYGHSPTHVISLGTFVHEFALAHGKRAFNIHVDCKGGDTLEPQSGRTEPCVSWYVEPDSAFDNFLAHDKPTLVDLRPLRTQRKLWEEVFTEGEQRLIDAYDAYLALPNVTPAVPLRPAKPR